MTDARTPARRLPLVFCGVPFLYALTYNNIVYICVYIIMYIMCVKCADNDGIIIIIIIVAVVGVLTRVPPVRMQNSARMILYAQTRLDGPV